MESQTELLLSELEHWIKITNDNFLGQRISCVRFSEQFSGFFDKAFLCDAFYVPVSKIPKPEFPELRDLGFGEFLDMDVDGITYNNTYFIKRELECELRLHFHELVHVCQWRLLSVKGFLMRYISEIERFGYRQAPLEIQAYDLDRHYAVGGQALHVSAYVEDQL